MNALRDALSDFAGSADSPTKTGGILDNKDFHLQSVA